MDELISLFIDLLDVLEDSLTSEVDEHDHVLFDSFDQDKLWNLKEKLEVLRIKERNS